MRPRKERGEEEELTRGSVRRTGGFKNCSRKGNGQGEIALVGANGVA